MTWLGVAPVPHPGAGGGGRPGGARRHHGADRPARCATSTTPPWPPAERHLRGDCSTAVQYFFSQYHQLQAWLDFLIAVVPAIVGVFWGAPLVARELETGTFRLAWTQSVTRTRWLALKLAVVGVAAMVVAGLFSLGVTWWFSRWTR